MDFFNKFSRKTSEIIGGAKVFSLACLLIISWLLAGPLFNFSEVWQLVINTFTSVVTFLIVFLIQHTQNRDTKSLQIKLDEIIKSIKKAKNSRIDLDNLSDDELKELEESYIKISNKNKKIKPDPKS